MRARCAPRHNQAILSTLIFVIAAVFVFHYGFLPPGSASYHHATTALVDTTFNNLFLDEAQCRRAFPELTKEIEAAVSQGEFDLRYHTGTVVNARIEDGQLFILHTPTKGELSNLMLQRQAASLHQLHRAITTSPAPLPNASLTIAIHDIPLAGTFSFARPTRSSTAKHIFPMPHFSFWSWPLPFIGSIASAARTIARLEAETGFARKDPRAVWRGTSWYNNGAGSSPRLRQELVAKTKGVTWADVQALDWETNSHDASNALKIEDFCRYRYIIHTEGVGYSGRLQFHQLCESVILSPPLDWMQHTSHLIKPILSTDLLSRAGSKRYPSAHVREAWPEPYAVDEANMVFVNPDWSDLEDTVQWLEDHPSLAAGVAKRQRDLYAYKGYVSPAAEVCYWRALVNGWSQVARPLGQEWEQEGVRFEEYTVTKADWRT